MSKAYIVTEGDYSDYHIEACFTAREKAEEYIKNAKELERCWDDFDIEEWNLDESAQIVNVINVYFTFTSPFSKREYEEKIETRIDKSIECKAYEYGKTELYGCDLERLHIKRIANPNKSFEEEISRVIKIAYDTAKKIKYLYEVENIKDLKEMRDRIE